MLSCLTLKIDRFSNALFHIVALYNNNTKLPSNQTCLHIRFWSGEKMYQLQNSFYMTADSLCFICVGFCAP